MHAYVRYSGSVDMAGNAVGRSTLGGTASDAIIKFDNIPPTVIVSTATLPLTNTILPYFVTFSERVMFFTEDCITVFGASATECDTCHAHIVVVAVVVVVVVVVVVYSRGGSTSPVLFGLVRGH